MDLNQGVDVHPRGWSGSPQEGPSKVTAPRHRSALAFFLLVFGLSMPWWILGLFLQNGTNRLGGLPDNFAITDVGSSFVATEAAMVLVYREEGFVGVKKLLRRTFDYKRIARTRWYLAIVLLWPLQGVLTYYVMGLAGIPLPSEWGVSLAILPLFAFYFIGAAVEELGYTGYAIDPAQDRWGALKGSLIVGSLWAIWHVPSMIDVGQTPTLIAFGLLATVGWRVLFVWIYNNTGRSLFAVTVSHAVENLTRDVFPGGRLGFQLADGAIGYSIVVITAALVTILWGPQTLARFRNTRPRRRTEPGWSP